MDERKKFAALRIAFGFIWLVDAWFKWQPAFFSGFVDYLSGSLENQPLLVQWWIHLWVNLVGINPVFFAYVTAVAETSLALALIFGILTRFAAYGGILFSLVIWSTAEGFGGPYQAGSTDIGSAVIYVLVFAALLIGRSWERFSLDGMIARRRAKAPPKTSP